MILLIAHVDLQVTELKMTWLKSTHEKVLQSQLHGAFAEHQTQIVIFGLQVDLFQKDTIESFESAIADIRCDTGMCCQEKVDFAFDHELQQGVAKGEECRNGGQENDAQY